MKSTALIAGCLVVLVLVSQVAATKNSNKIVELGRVLERINSLLSKPAATSEGLRTKKACMGYMCSTSHLSGSAGKLAVQSALMNFLHNCAKDPTCSRGKGRRRRSPISLRSIIFQAQALS